MELFELPVRSQQVVLSYTQYALPLCAIISEKKYHPWILEKFIQLKSFPTVSKSGNHFQYTIFKGEDVSYDDSHYPDVMDISIVNSSISDNILKTIESGIHDQHYFQFELDEFYMPCKEAHGKTHLVHPSLFYGYDKTSTELLGIGFIKGGKFGKFRLHYKDLIQSLESRSFIGKEHNIDSHESMDAFLYRLKTPGKNYEFGYQKLIGLIENYLNSTAYGNMLGGINTYNVVLNNLKDPATPQRHIKYNTTHFMYENKRMFEGAIRYVSKQNGLLSLIADLLESYAKVVEIFESLRFMHIDFAVKQGAWPYVVKSESANVMFKKLKHAIDIETDILSKILKRFPLP